MVFHQSVLEAEPLPLATAATRQASSRSLTPVRLWLWVVAFCIFLMVIVGGATRLTQSGLSITEWKPVMGIVPPLTADAWQAEFQKYQAIPQYARLFPDMDLAGFKGIFYWEWGHRLLGRIIGALFALPLIGFWLTGRLTPALKPRLLGLLALGGLQGLIGWWMVKSGLSERVSVSQYRLAVHLVTASITFAWAIWLAEGPRPYRPSWRGAERRGNPAPQPADLNLNASPAMTEQLTRLRSTASLLVACLFLQLFLGALVAGLHAGLVYNTWPLMDGRLVPPIAALTQDSPAWRNLFENVTTVQFDHRMLAYGVLLLAFLHAADAWFSARGSDLARRALLIALLVTLQACLGITALLLVVPLWAALLHQAFAMVVLGTAVLHRRRLPAGSHSRTASRA